MRRTWCCDSINSKRMPFGRKLKLSFGVVLFLTGAFCAIRLTSRQLPGVPHFSSLSTDQAKIDENSNVIHIVHTILGENAVYRTITMLKSLLYYQGRYRTEQTSCCFIMASNTGCKTNLTQQNQQTFRLHFHFIRDSVSSNMLDVSLRSWKNKTLVYSLYDLQECLTLVRRIPNRHPAGPSALCRMYLPSLLPKRLEKVILLDTDILLNDDISNLWRHFENFTGSQLFGMAWEQESSEPDCKHKKTQPIPLYGLNAGVALLHLDRMRKFGWDEMLSTALAKILEESGRLRQGEQDIFNKLAIWFPHLYYQLPCEWNTQLYAKIAASCCPVVWPDRLPFEMDCITRGSPGTPKKPSLLRIAHFDRSGKPEDPRWNPTLRKQQNNVHFRLSQSELIARFNEMYIRFRAIPSNCFI